MNDAKFAKVYTCFSISMVPSDFDLTLKQVWDKNDNEAKIYPTWECKVANFDFSFRKGHVLFYCKCKLWYNHII